MNELQVKTLTFEPAKVEFNYDELAAILDENLKRYAGLTFTEKEAADCKKTIAELRKGKKAVDAYHKETKKKLTAAVTEFEDQCKALNQKFDEVITPLVDQHDQFEHDRKERKRKQIQDIIDSLLDQQGLNEKYAAQLVIPDEYYNKGKSLKVIKEELTTKAEHLGIQQDKDEANAEIIKGHVELINTKMGVSLPVSSYLSLLDYQDVASIKHQIESDAERESNQASYKEVPLSSAPGHVKATNQEEQFVEKFEVTGTESQLNDLEEYMSAHGINWSVIE